MARSWTSTRRPEAAGRREPVFSTKGEAATERAPLAHHGVEALVSSDAACVATLGASHCAARVATVYTNAPERLRRAVFANLCTLLRHHGAPARPPRRNSVHKCPGTASKDRFRQSVYTIASPPAARESPASQQCTQMPQNGSERPFSAICVHYCVTTGRPRGPRVATVYTNGPERRRKVVFGDLCTLLCPPASPRGARATLASQQCTQMAQNSSVRPFSAICVHYCVPLRHHRPPAQPSCRNSVHNHEAPNIPAPGRRTSPRSG